MLKDGEGGFIRLSRPFFMVLGITVLYDRVGCPAASGR